ncbi:hypothetical protein HK100_012709 [Physocladia obscura]|uniref:Major facilitator superfamily (MFS) profile domain-containing protein n=1 Tax=Physocladia obscura TaxID=109957 RepID=A0AAD5T1Y3_9FUNG|nr:hypothetical protein HK100_012709 [Physocladia obscura]
MTDNLRAESLDPNPPKLFSRALVKSWFAISIAMLSLIACGYDQTMSWDMPLLSSFTDDITPKVNPLALATFDSLTNYAGMMAAVFMPFSYDWKGRKFGFAIGNVFAFIGSCISVFGTLNLSQDVTTIYYLGRFIAVLGIDIAAGCAYMYAAEVSHPAHRAFFTGLFGMGWSIGNFINNLIIFLVTFMDYSSWQWRIPTIMQAVFSVIILAALPFIPESPRTLVSKGRFEEAEKVIRDWTGTSSEEFVKAQMVELRESFKDAAKSDTILETYNMRPLWATTNSQRRIFLLIFTNSIINMLNLGATSGVFGTLIYDAIGLGSDRQKTALNLGNNAFACIASFFMSMYIEQWGRRRTYIIAYTISFFLGFLGAIAMEGYRDTSGIGYSYLYIASIFIGTLYSAPIGPVQVIFQTELLSYNFRAKGKALNDFVNKPANVALTYFQSFVYSAIDTRSFWVAQGYTLLFLGWNWFTMPETKGRTLEEVDDIFDHPSPMYTEWINRKSGQTNYVKYSLEVLKSKAEGNSDALKA